MRWLPGLAIVVAVGACAHAPPPPPPPPEPAPITVAVLSFADFGPEAEKGCVMAILSAGFRAVGHREIEQAVPTPQTVDYQTVGRAVGADLIIDAMARRTPTKRKSSPPRLISTRSGDVLAVSKKGARLDRSYSVAERVCTDLLNQLP